MGSSQVDAAAGSPVVIGAGIAGLVRAMALTDLGLHPIIIDPEAAGGLIKSVQAKGFSMECGANTLVDTAELRTILSRVGLSEKVRYPVIPKYRQYIWYQGAAQGVPRGPGQLLKSKLLPGAEKLKALRGVFKKAPKDVLSEDASVQKLFSSLFSPHIAANLLAPVLRGIFGGDASRLIASVVFPKLWTHLANGGSLVGYLRSRKALGKRVIFCLEGGNNTLIEALTKELKSKSTTIQSSVKSITQSAGPSRFVVTLANGESVAASSISIATAGAATARFMHEFSPPLETELLKVRYAPIVVVHMEVPGTEILPDKGFGVLFPQTEGALLGVLFNSNLFPHTAPAGKKLLTVCFGGVGNDSQVERSDSDLGVAAVSVLEKYLGIRGSAVLLISRWIKAIPQYEGNVLKLNKLMREIEASVPGLSFIGADCGGVGVPARVETALSTKFLENGSK